MAKSTGNFMTLEQLVEKYGADASRIAMADAGDGVADANFEEDVADKAVLKLYILREWCEEQVQNESKLRSGPADSFFDKIFADELNCLVHECRTHYQATNYKLALKAAFYGFTAARDWYRESTIAAGVIMHKDLIFRYIELQALVLSVIAPHWSEHIWLEVLEKPSTVQNARWPTVPPADAALGAARDYVRFTSSSITSAEAAQEKKKSKGKTMAFDPKKPKKVTIFMASKFPSWQEKYIELLGNMWDESRKTISDEGALIAQVKQHAGKDTKKAMPFVQGLKRRLANGEAANVVLSRELAFNEAETLKQVSAIMKRAANLNSLDIVQVDEAGKGNVILGTERTVYDLPPQALSAVPGAPSFEFENVES